MTAWEDPLPFTGWDESAIPWMGVIGYPPIGIPAWYGRTLVKIDKWYPSSKRCFACGHILDSLSLDSREWTCPECGVHHDRDINAAKNIHAVGLTVFEACGEAVRPGAVKAKLGKPR